MKSVELRHEILDSADEFLERHGSASEPGCQVLDIRMPGLGGLELQDELLKRGKSIPIIFITGHGDVPMAVEAMQKGAVDFIQKPFRDQELLDRIHLALRTDEERRAQIKRAGQVKTLIERLTQRENEVFELVVTGKPNKVIAYELGVSQRTVEIHRARMMEKNAGPLAGRSGPHAHRRYRRSRMSAFDLVRTVDTAFGVRRRRRQPRRIDRIAAVHALAEFAGVHSLQRV